MLAPGASPLGTWETTSVNPPSSCASYADRAADASSPLKLGRSLIRQGIVNVVGDPTPAQRLVQPAAGRRISRACPLPGAVIGSESVSMDNRAAAILIRHPAKSIVNNVNGNAYELASGSADSIQRGVPHAWVITAIGK